MTSARQRAKTKAVRLNIARRKCCQNFVGHGKMFCACGCVDEVGMLWWLASIVRIFRWWHFFWNLYGIVVSRDSSLIELLSHVETESEGHNATVCLPKPLGKTIWWRYLAWSFVADLLDKLLFFYHFIVWEWMNALASSHHLQNPSNNRLLRMCLSFLKPRILPEFRASEGGRSWGFSL